MGDLSYSVSCKLLKKKKKRPAIVGSLVTWVLKVASLDISCQLETFFTLQSQLRLDPQCSCQNLISF